MDQLEAFIRLTATPKQITLGTIDVKKNYSQINWVKKCISNLTNASIRFVSGMNAIRKLKSNYFHKLAYALIKRTTSHQLIVCFKNFTVVVKSTFNWFNQGLEKKNRHVVKLTTDRCTITYKSNVKYLAQLKI